MSVHEDIERRGKEGMYQPETLQYSRMFSPYINKFNKCSEYCLRKPQGKVEMRHYV
jgi:hypothetical protein